MTTPLSGMTFVSKLGIATINLQTKFEISNYSQYEDMKSCAKCTYWGSLGRLGVTQGHRQCHHSIERIYDFLFDFNRICASISYRFRDLATYLSKFADFIRPRLHLAPPWGRLRSKSCGFAYVILCSAVLVEDRLETDRRRRAQGICRAGIASCG